MLALTGARSRLSDEEVNLYEQICHVVKALPPIEMGSARTGRRSLTPHLLVRALARVFGISYQDGYYHVYTPHAWLLTPAGNVIDVCPVGAIGAILVDTSPDSPLRTLYRPCSPNAFGEHFGGTTFRNDIRAVTQVIRRTRARLTRDAANSGDLVTVTKPHVDDNPCPIGSLLEANDDDNPPSNHSTSPANVMV